MNLFDLIIVQPIFNVLVLIYGLLPGSDFGVAVILFTVLIRLLMWPLVKKQLHQTKVIRKIQPELKKIKVKAKGNKTLEGQLMMELYRERGVNPFSSLGLLLVQLPIFIALYQVINIITSQRGRIEQFTYSPLESLAAIKSIIAQPQQFNESLLGVINLAERALQPDGLYWPAIILAVVAAALQYLQARQTMPKPEEGKRLRDMLKSQANGKDIDQSEVTAAVSNKMITILPIVTLIFGFYLPAALVLYFAVSSLVAVIQQHIILNQDVDEMEQMASKKNEPLSTTVKKAKARAERAQEAEIVPSSVEPESQPLVSVKKTAKKKRKKR